MYRNLMSKQINLEIAVLRKFHNHGLSGKTAEVEYDHF